MATMNFGAYHKEKRIALGLTLRVFCLRFDFDPGNVSRIERGRVKPPADPDVLTRHAKALSLKKGSDDWVTFFDLAAAGRGEIPADLLSDDDVVAKLPVVFRTLRGDKVDPSRIDALIDLIRRT